MATRPATPGNWGPRIDGLTERATVGIVADAELSKVVPVWTVSTTGEVLPLASPTQILPLTLLFGHPVWNPTLTGLPTEVVPVMLYIAVKRRPVVGEAVLPAPSPALSPSSSVSIVSAIEHAGPEIKTPDKHSANV
jgi:hypothetical protein